jgi:hypothetical protein
VYEASSYPRRPSATSVRGLKVLVYDAFVFVEDEAHDSEAATEEQVA